MQKQWNIRHPRVAQSMSVEEIVHTILVNRGHQTEETQANFLSPRLSQLFDPFLLPDLEPAIERVEKALRENEPILIYADYDVDGMTSSALMHRFLKALGARVEVFIPERLKEGYGLTAAGIKRAREEHAFSFLIALDCGSTNTEIVEELKADGIDVMIIDHHQLPLLPPKPVAFVNPQRGQRGRYLATVGLVFKFCHGFLKHRKTPHLFDLKSALDLVALGTIADLVPLEADNRIFVKQGLKSMAMTRSIGLAKLMEQARFKKRLTPAFCGFTLAPRLNASGRLAHGKIGWKLLTTDDPKEAEELAQQLEHLNDERRAIEFEVTRDAFQEVAASVDWTVDQAVVVSSPNWHPGVIGIVASRLVKEYYKPAVVIAIDAYGKGKGSCRSIEGVSLIEALGGCENYLIGFGGHAMAAGLEIEADRIPDFKQALSQWLMQHASLEKLAPQLKIDLELAGEELCEPLASALEDLEPFGSGNPAPVFTVQQARMMSVPRVFGQQHLFFRAQSQGKLFDAVAFGLAGKMAKKPISSVVDLAGQWEMDNYTRKPCLKVADWR